MGIYDYSIRTRDGGIVSLSDYKGKVLLIVNTATGCGFTPQYDELQDLYEADQDKGLEILDFPCNQFGGQAPGDDEEIHSFCTGRFGITFPQFSKIEVNGENADPLYKYLTANAPFKGFGEGQTAAFMDDMLKKMDPEYAGKPSIKWNFTKFVVDRQGSIVGRFEPTAPKESWIQAVEEALA